MNAVTENMIITTTYMEQDMIFLNTFYFVILLDSLTIEKINDLSDNKFMVILL